jgi:hypothetical protein
MTPISLKIAGAVGRALGTLTIWFPLGMLFYLIASRPILGLPLWLVLFVCARNRELSRAWTAYFYPRLTLSSIEPTIRRP